MKNQGYPKNRKKSHKKLWIILGIVAAVLVILVVLIVRGLSNVAQQLTSAMENTAEVRKGEIQVTTEGIGVVEASEAAAVAPEYNVTLSKLYKQDGEPVLAGEAIAEYENLVLDDTIATLESRLSQLEQQLSYMDKSGSTTVKAPVSGRIKELYAAEGDSVMTVQKQQPGLALISADGQMKVEFSLEREATEGQKVRISYEDSEVEGRLEEIAGSQAAAYFEDSDRYEIGVEVTVFAEDGQILGRGITACGHGVYVTADSGIVKSVSVKKQEKISAGNTLFRLEDVAYSREYLTALEQREQLAGKVQTAREYKKGFVVTAETDGIISGLTARPGDSLPAGTPLYTLLQTETYQAVLQIDELDVKGIEKGQQVEVTADAIPDTVYQGTVTGISLAGENTGGVGVYKVTVSLELAEELLPGMSANGKITKDAKKDVLLVPVDTLKTIDGKKSVTVVKPDGTYESREVTLGLVNNEFAEVLEGVSEGEKLQVIMKLSDIYSQMGISLEGTSIE